MGEGGRGEGGEETHPFYFKKVFFQFNFSQVKL